MSHSHSKTLPKAPRQLSIKDALRVRSAAMPWSRALCSALATCLPILIGLLFGDMVHGFTAALGAFTYLYTGNETYRQRSRKLIIVALCLAAAMILGTLMAPYMIVLSIAVGIIGFAAYYILNMLQLLIPGPLFFVLMFAVATGLPQDPSSAWERGLFVLLGGLLSWIIGMIGGLWRRDNTAEKAVKHSYHQLAALADSIGTAGFYQQQHQAVLALQQADKLVMRSEKQEARLHHLNTAASEIFLKLTALGGSQQKAADAAEHLQVIADGIAVHFPISLKAADTADLELNQVLDRAGQTLKKADKAEELPLAVSSWERLRGGLSKSNVILRHAFYYGLFICIASLLSHWFGFQRPYWVPVACAAVLIGANTTLTIHRAIQRSLGTIAGTIIGGIVLAFEPSGYALFMLVGLFQFAVELVIVRNYVFANVFIAPLVLIIVETMNPGNPVSYFVSARVIDTIAGSILAIIAVLLLWRGIHIKYLPVVQQEALEQMRSLLLEDKTDQRKHEQLLVTKIIQLRAVYERSLGDLSGNTDKYWPVVMHTQHAGYLLLYYTRENSLMEPQDRKAVADALESLVQRKKIALTSDKPKHLFEELVHLEHALSSEHVNTQHRAMTPSS